jgi:ABC-2 type transport system ATP-binding protein
VEIVRVEHVSKRFRLRNSKSLKDLALDLGRRRPAETFLALDDIFLAFEAGDTVGLVGPNGSGKSTLLKIIGGILGPDQGRVLLRGRIAALLELGAGFHPDLTGRENIYLNASVLGISRAETDRYFSEIVDFSGIPDFIDTQVKFYSSGMYVRLAFAVAVHVDPDILLVDEVLAVGDEPFQQKCLEKIRQFQEDGRTIIFVSHSPAQVAEVCDRVVVLEKGRVVEDDIPQVALSRLRQDYLEVIESERAANQATSGYAAELARVEASSPDTAEVGSDGGLVIRPGMTLRLDFWIRFLRRTPGWIVHVKIEDLLGSVHVEVNTRDTLKAKLPDAEGLTRLTLTYPNLCLGDGHYVVNAGVYDAQGILLDAETRAALVRATSNHRSVGPVYADVGVDCATGLDDTHEEAR